MVAGAGGNVERDVIFRLKVEVDKRSAQAFTTFKKEFEDLEKAKEEASRKSINKRLQEEKRFSREIIKAARETARVHATGLKDQENALEQARKKAAEFEKQTSAATQQFKKDLQGSFTGILTLARGIALLGISGSEDFEKLARGLVRIQGLFDLAKGAIATYGSITNVIKALTTATTAATTAQLALNAAQTGGAVAGAVGGVARGVAGTAGGAAAGAAGAAAIIPVAAIATAGAALVGTLALFDSDFRTELGEFLGILETGKERLEKTLRELSSQSRTGRESFSNELQLLTSRLALSSERIKLATEFGPQTRATGAALRRGQVSELGETLRTRQRALFRREEGQERIVGEARETVRALAGTPKEQEGQAVLSEQLAILKTIRDQIVPVTEALVEIRRREKDIVVEQVRIERDEAKKALEERIALMKKSVAEQEKSLAVSERELKVSEDRAKQIRETTLSAEQRFGALSAFEQRRVLRTATKGVEGQELNRRQTALLQQFGGLGQFGQIAAAQNVRRAQVGGFAELFGISGQAGVQGIADQRVAALQAPVQERRERIVELKADIKIALDADPTAIGEAIAEELQNALRAIGRAVESRALVKAEAIETDVELREATAAAGLGVQ